MSVVPDQAGLTDGGAGIGSEPLGKRDSAAFLVRIWREPTSPDGVEGVVRCYMKNLKTGEECYTTSAGALANQVLAQLEMKAALRSAPSGTDDLRNSRFTGHGGGVNQS